MHWMHRDPVRRTNAERNHPGTKTVVCCALNYYQGSPEVGSFDKAVISSYARGEDYHRVMEARLEKLARFVEEAWDVKTKVYVDTGPMVEKSYAVAAGLGWMGKHSNLLSRQGSSWFFLGEILLPLELTPDRSERNHCGTCTRCIEACPTRAIVQPYVVDARLCISYLNIELRGSIPRELRPRMGLRIFGCDDCQDVCPWNRFAKKSEEPAFSPRQPLASMELTDMLQMSRGEFLAVTRGSAIRRARYAGLLRNVAVALGNSGNRRAAAALIGVLDHPEALVRGHTAWALGSLCSAEARDPLADQLARERDGDVREEIRWALNRLRT
jgi:epoxyqueuosine reductase